MIVFSGWVRAEKNAFLHWLISTGRCLVVFVLTDVSCNHKTPRAGVWWRRSHDSPRVLLLSGEMNDVVVSLAIRFLLFHALFETVQVFKAKA